MISKNSSSCNRAISFESIFTYIGISTLLRKAKFEKRSGVDVFTILNVLISSVFKGYPNLYRFFASTEGKHYLLAEIQHTDFFPIQSMTGSL